MGQQGIRDKNHPESLPEFIFHARLLFFSRKSPACLGNACETLKKHARSMQKAGLTS
jgi:hypothetical protein